MTTTNLARFCWVLAIVTVMQAVILSIVLVNINHRVDRTTKLARTTAAELDGVSNDVSDLSSKVDDVDTRVSDLEDRPNQ